MNDFNIASYWGENLTVHNLFSVMCVSCRIRCAKVKRRIFGRDYASIDELY